MKMNMDIFIYLISCVEYLAVVLIVTDFSFVFLFFDAFAFRFTLHKLLVQKVQPVL